MRFHTSTHTVRWAALLFFSVTAGLCAGQAPQDANKPLFSAPDSTYKSPFDADTGDGLGEAFRRMMLAVVIVILLGAAAMVAVKKFLPKINQTQGKKIRILETIHLGARKSVHLLQVGTQQILIASAADRITKLADIYPEAEGPLDESTPGEVIQ